MIPVIVYPKLSKRKLTFLYFFLVITLSIFSQGNAKDSLFAPECQQCITMEKTFGGYIFYQDGKRLSFSQLAKTVASVEAASSQMHNAKSNNGFASVLGFAGGFCVGWPLGTAMAGGEPNWALAAVGAGLIVVAIPLSNKAVKQAKAAVDIYNGSLPHQSFWNNKSLNLTMKGRQVGLQLSF